MPVPARVRLLSENCHCHIGIETKRRLKRIMVIRVYKRRKKYKEKKTTNSSIFDNVSQCLIHSLLYLGCPTIENLIIV